MNIILILIGVAFGVIGGMGMGGGIIMIPALTLLLGFAQHDAQALNLAVFLPMAIAAIITHLKNTLIAIALKDELLRKIFGVFLILVALWRVYSMEIRPRLQHKKN